MKNGGAKPGKPKGALFWPELASEEVGPLYGVFGEEDFLVNREAGLFLQSPAFSTNPSLNVERFLAEDTPPSKVLESARTLPFLGKRRLVMVSGPDNYKADKLNQFLDYFKDPSPATCLVFTGGKLDARTKFAKALKKNGKVQIIKKLYPNQIPAFLQERAKVRGKQLGPRAGERLAELGGLGLGALDSEIEKLCLYTGREKRITLSHVLAVSGKGRLYGIFDFTDALAAGDLARSLTAWDQLYALGEPAIKVLAMITRLFRQIIEVRQILEEGGGQAQVQRSLRVPPKALATLMARARRESMQNLGHALEMILNADQAFKSSPGSDRVIMERLLFELCEGKKGHPARSRAGVQAGLRR
jgi:DNA polymerase-3 subunit delta